MRQMFNTVHSSQTIRMAQQPTMKVDQPLQLGRYPQVPGPYPPNIVPIGLQQPLFNQPPLFHQPSPQQFTPYMSVEAVQAELRNVRSEFEGRLTSLSNQVMQQQEEIGRQRDIIEQQKARLDGFITATVSKVMETKTKVKDEFEQIKSDLESTQKTRFEQHAMTVNTMVSDRQQAEFDKQRADLERHFETMVEDKMKRQQAELDKQRGDMERHFETMLEDKMKQQRVELEQVLVEKHTMSVKTMVDAEFNKHQAGINEHMGSFVSFLQQEAVGWKSALDGAELSIRTALTQKRDTILSELDQARTLCRQRMLDDVKSDIEKRRDELKSFANELHESMRPTQTVVTHQRNRKVFPTKRPKTHDNEEPPVPAPLSDDSTM